VNDAAHSFGVRPGQTVAEATALVAHLAVRELEPHKVQTALERIAEIGMGFGGPVAWESPDTVWVDVTGSGTLWGEGESGERALAEALLEQVRALGHRARLGVSTGPHLARAFARWGNWSPEGLCLVPASRTAQELAELPLLALPLPAETVEWFARLGVLSVQQLEALSPRALGPRLGKDARRIRALCQGHDDTPLTPYAPAPVLVEEIQWEEALSGLEPLLFSLRGLVGRLSARLEGRGEAAQLILLELQYDAAVARQERLGGSNHDAGSRSGGPGGGGPGGGPGLELQFELASPLWREAEIERVLRARLEGLRLGAPVVALRLTVPVLTPAQVRQLQLGRRRGESARWGTLEGANEEDLSVLLAELAADVGEEQVGRLRAVNRHRPEASSVLEPLRSLGGISPGRAAPAPRGPQLDSRRRAPRKKSPATQLTLAPLSNRGALDTVTRLLPRPVPWSGLLRVGELVGLGRGVYSIARVRFVQRLEEVEWWTAEPTSRDYLRVWLTGPEGGLDALVFVDRITGKRYLQAFWD
jgi:protein ImuB